MSVLEQALPVYKIHLLLYNFKLYNILNHFFHFTLTLQINGQQLHLFLCLMALVTVVPWIINGSAVGMSIDLLSSISNHDKIYAAQNSMRIFPRVTIQTSHHLYNLDKQCSGSKQLIQQGFYYQLWGEGQKRMAGFQEILKFRFVLSCS